MATDDLPLHEKEFATPQEALVHFGVKGMHWGVSRSRAKRETRLEKVATGQAGKLTKARVALTETSSLAAARNGGVKGAAANKLANMKAVDARLATGEASVKDILNRFGGDKLIDTGGKHRDRR